MSDGTIDFNVDFGRVHLWQYAATAPNLTSILNNEASFYKKAIGDFWDNWYRDVFNVDTANGFGLELIGNLLGVKRPSNLQSLGSNVNIDYDNFLVLKQYSTNAWHRVALRSDGTFQTIMIDTREETDAVDDETYRRFLKAYMSVYNTNGSVAEINRYLNIVFPGRRIRVADNRNMTISIVVGFAPTDEEYAILNSPYFLPLPAGVRFTLFVGSMKNIFGFAGSGLDTWWDSSGGAYPKDKYGTFFS